MAYGKQKDTQDSHMFQVKFHNGCANEWAEQNLELQIFSFYKLIQGWKTRRSNSILFQTLQKLFMDNKVLG